MSSEPGLYAAPHFSGHLQLQQSPFLAGRGSWAFLHLLYSVVDSGGGVRLIFPLQRGSCWEMVCRLPAAPSVSPANWGGGLECVSAHFSRPWTTLCFLCIPSEIMLCIFLVTLCEPNLSAVTKLRVSFRPLCFSESISNVTFGAGVSYISVAHTPGSVPGKSQTLFRC